MVFDWAFAVKRNREELLGIVVALIAALPDAVAATVPRHLYLWIFSVLRPVESSLRRLIFVAARGMTVAPRLSGAMPKGGIPSKKSNRVPAFPLFDLRKNVDPKTRPGRGAGVWGFDGSRRVTPPSRKPMPDDPVITDRLRRRLSAVLVALDDIPKQATRLARMLASGRSKYRQPMRPGRPPGHRTRHQHPVDALLVECQTLALMALNTPKPP